MVLKHRFLFREYAILTSIGGVGVKGNGKRDTSLFIMLKKGEVHHFVTVKKKGGGDTLLSIMLNY